MVFTLDIGATYTKYAHIDNGKIINKGKWQTVNDFLMLVRLIDNVICRDVEYIGISSGGFWDSDGNSIGYETVESTSKNNLKKFLAEKYSCPVYIENDARCALIAEKEYGVLKSRENAVMFVLGSSLGCAVMINGRLYKGTTNQAGAMFMMPEYYDKSNYQYDKWANSVELTKEFDPSAKMGNMLLLEEAAVQGDSKAIELLERYSKTVALKCRYAYLMYDPELIVLGGGISNSKYITEKIKNHLNGFFENEKSKRTPLIVTAEFGNDSNLLGAYVLGIKYQGEYL